MIGRVAVVGIAGVIVLAACSNSSPTSHDPTTSALSASPASPGAQGFGGPRGPAASGTVAAISGTTMQVQNPQSGQVAVMWTSSTKFTHQIATTLAAVKAGDCVTAVAPSGTSFDATAFTASSLVVSTGACTVVAGPGRSGVPSGFPSGSRPSGFPSGRPRVGAIASGKVTSIAGNTLVIAARQFRDSGTSNKTVTVTSSTKITTEAATTATSVKVGKCVTAEGKADSTGAVSATQVRITDPVNGQCDTFGRFGGGGG
jgi:Domain of unknown function (DUF5666)